MKGLRLAILFCVLLSTSVYGNTIKVYTYHNHPPFIIGKGKGLTYEIVELLNRKMEQPGYTFKVKILPRKRLNEAIQDWKNGTCKIEGASCDSAWIVLWVDPVWGFDTRPPSRFLWTKIVNDTNSIISTKNNPVFYEGLESLVGKKFGGIRGHKYVGIDDLVAKGQLQRFDGDKERDNLLKLVYKRFDVTLLPKSTVLYYMQHDNQLTGKLYIAPKPHQTATRHFMFPISRQDLKNSIENLELPEDPRYQTLLQQYGFSL